MYYVDWIATLEIVTEPPTANPNQTFCSENLRLGPLKHIFRLSTDGGFGEVLEDVRKLGWDVYLLGTVDCVWKRHGWNVE